MAEEKIAEKQIVVFSINTEEFGVEISEVKEIIKLEEITKVPNADGFIEGIINLRGKIIVIIDLAKKLKLKSAEKKQDMRIIIIEVGDMSVGMIVDSCNEVLRLTDENFEEAPEMITKKIHSGYIQAVGVLKDRLIILLDLIKLMSDDGKIISQIAKNNKIKD